LLFLCIAAFFVFVRFVAGLVGLFGLDIFGRGLSFALLLGLLGFLFLA